ncbi:hypothetical protein RvY_02047 [Ramazzottius varieornatus]|uniref:DDE Tnp4 domain-containing protein n=1 Tax=Ramazzottius varieornatus TaxID=947166 RepID=A0A1D1UPC6_RAMVA|nr:hypothetical protein RvY_02047 [Ramazzottius varieornatus]
MVTVVYWIRACCILHNLLTQDCYNPGLKDGSEKKNKTQEQKIIQLPKEFRNRRKQEKETEGNKKSEFVKQVVLEAHRYVE